MISHKAKMRTVDKCRGYDAGLKIIKFPCTMSALELFLAHSKSTKKFIPSINHKDSLEFHAH